MQIAIIDQVNGGRMLGDYEIIKNIPAQMSLICYSHDAEIKTIDKKDFLALEPIAEAWRQISKMSELQYF